MADGCCGQRQAEPEYYVAACFLPRWLLALRAAEKPMELQGGCPGTGQRKGVTGMTGFLHCGARLPSDSPSPRTFCGLRQGGRVLGSGHAGPAHLRDLGQETAKVVWDVGSTASFQMAVCCIKSFSTLLLESVFTFRKAPAQWTPSHLRA